VIQVNGSPVAAPIQAGFVTLRRAWQDGDRIELDLALPVRLEPIDPVHADCVALVRGPLVLFALTESAPRLTREQLLAPRRVPGRPAWQIDTAAGPLRLVPFTEIGGEAYATYLQVS